MKHSTFRAIAATAAIALLLVGANALFGNVSAHPVADGAALAMGVITGYGTGMRDPASLKAIEGVYAAATLRQINSEIAVAVGDSTNSLRYVAELPADAILDPTSSYFFGATGISDFDVGIAYPNGGAVISADCLVNGDDISSAGSQTLIGHGTLTAANANKRVWELAGLSANPGGNLSIVTKQNAGTAAAAKVLFNLRYSKGA